MDIYYITTNLYIIIENFHLCLSNLIKYITIKIKEQIWLNLMKIIFMKIPPLR